MLTINSLRLEETDEEQHTGIINRGVNLFKNWQKNREEKAEQKQFHKKVMNKEFKDGWDNQKRTTPEQLNVIKDPIQNRLNQLNQVQVDQPPKSNTGRNLKIAGAVGAGVLGLRALEKRNQERQKNVP